jgi:hypothetical protein
MKQRVWPQGGVTLALSSFLLSASLLLAPPTLAQHRGVHRIAAPAGRLPSRIARQVARIDRTADRFSTQNNTRPLSTTKREIERLVDLMGYREETLLLQQEAKQLNQQLLANPDPATADRLLSRLRMIGQQIAQDPNARRILPALTENRLQRLFSTGNARSARRMLVSFDGLRRGDIMLVRSGDNSVSKFLWAMWYSHAGTYDGNQLVLEANPDGVRLKPLENWRQPGSQVALGRDWRVPAAQVLLALDWAKDRYRTDGSTAYNYWFPNKSTDERLYCSQLVWKIHQHLGVNLDSNNSTYLLWLAARWGKWVLDSVAVPAVAPDEIRLSPMVEFYSEGAN